MRAFARRHRRLLWMGRSGRDALGSARGPRNGLAVSTQTLDMGRDRLTDQTLDFLARLADGDRPRKVWDPGAPARVALLEDHRVIAYRSRPFRPALLRIALSVPRGTSVLGLPATVTVPGFVGWRNWRWLPRWRSNRQPSCSINRMTSRTFTAAERFIVWGEHEPQCVDDVCARLRAGAALAQGAGHSECLRDDPAVLALLVGDGEVQRLGHPPIVRRARRPSTLRRPI